MPLKFSWNQSGNIFRPESKFLLPDKEPVRFLSDLLCDDGGLDLPRTIPWLDEGIARLEAVTSGETTNADWSRESWGVKIEPEVVEIYFLLQEDYSASIDTRLFQKALLAWREFLQSGPLDSTGSISEMDFHI